MKRKLTIALILILFCVGTVWGAKKLTDLTEDTSPTSDDLVMTVNDPGGTAANRKVTISNLFGSSLYSRIGQGLTAQTFTASDASPDVTNGGTEVVQLWRTADTTTITDFDDGSGHGDLSAGDSFILIFDYSTVIDCSNNANIYGHGNNDFTGTVDKDMAIVTWEGSIWLFKPFETKSTNFTTLAIPNAESTDATLTAIGQTHLRGDEDRVSYHAGAGGEIAGEVTKSLLDMAVVTFDPSYMYDQESTNRTVPIMTVNAKLYPNGIIIDYIAISYNKDPTTELDADLRRADAQIGLASAADIDEIDTTSGVFTEDTDANLNAGAAVAAGQFVYIGFDADPADANVICTFTMIFHAEED